MGHGFGCISLSLSIIWCNCQISLVLFYKPQLAPSYLCFFKSKQYVGLLLMYALSMLRSAGL